MDYKAEWEALRNELYGIVKVSAKEGFDNGHFGNVLLSMIMTEDKARGVDTEKRHSSFGRNLTMTDIVSIYESEDRS